jgi:NDP-sugar pyrophosphorylase family protein
MMQAVILAGGLGTRLRDAVDDRPKALAVVAGQPFLAYLLVQLREQGFCDVVLCVGHLGEQIRDHFGDGRRWGVSIQYAVERQLLGTAGALKNAAPLIDGTFLVLNGDSYLDDDLRQVVALHQRRRDVPHLAGTLAMVWAQDDTAAYGALQLGPGLRIERFREKVRSGIHWINAGVYVLEPQVLATIPAGRTVSIERETFPWLLEQGQQLYACPMTGFFADIGTPQGYRAFQGYVASRGLPTTQT